ncbi:MAG: signal peptide peptidase SppA [Raoultibacter sp.]
MAQENNDWQQQPAQQQPPYNQQAQPAVAPQQQQPAYTGAPQPAPYGYQPATPVYVRPAKKSRGWIVALVAIILLFATIIVGTVSCSAALSSFGGPLATSPASGRLFSDSVGIIDISGTIQYDGTTCSPEGLKAQLDKAEDDPHIKAVVLRVDSGGGTATAGEEMATYTRDFSKPIVVSSASMNASAAYEISSQADYIYTAKTTAIGAIGTAMQVSDLSMLLEKLGIKVENITSADSKDSSYGTRPLTEEERAYYQKQINDINETFIETVAQGRGITTEEARALATGLTFTGMDAVKNGLADEIGTLEDACAKAADLAGITDYETLYLQEESLDMSSLLGLLGSSSSSEEQLAAAIKELGIHGSLS